ncbi:MAG: misacylated tRNA(Ala) deacylase [Granulosicoccus sp.]|jgi:misacylated tRNA(Ala) deacylase
MTHDLYRDDSYLKNCDATITAITEQGVETDQSVFYPLGGGQLGDTGVMVLKDGTRLTISDTRKDRETGRQFHIVENSDTQSPDATPSPDAAQSLSNILSVGDAINLELDWERRYNMMRFHSCLHLLCSLIDASVTSGSIQVDRARLDFDLKDPIDKDPITEALNELMERDIPMSSRYITDAELDAQPELVRTMSVQPPRNASGTIRLVEFAGVDLQPCGGTHVASTAEIGRVLVKKIEKKGKQNRRITLVFE